MGSYPDVAIFRRFGSLTMLNLMRLQAELLVIEDELRSTQAADDVSTHPDVYSYSTDFRKLSDSKDPDNKLLLLMEKSHQKLEQYSESRCKLEGALEADALVRQSSTTSGASHSA
jgi:hypothetical protein